MLSRSSWLPLSEGMADGERRRVDHDCGSGRTLTIQRDVKGTRAHCFRCNDSDWVPPEPVPLAVRLERIRKAQEADNRIAQGCVPPAPAVRSWSLWPEAHRLWLLKAGLSSADVGRLGAYYHPPSDRVVVPILEGQKAVFWQARSVDPKRQPKYMAPPIDKSKIIARYGSAPTVTLVEDLLSAYKVGLVAEGWSMLGTSLNDNMLAALINRGCDVNVWLDPDTAGIRASKRVLASLRAAGITARNIVSTKDPKLLHRAQIKELLCQTLK